MPTKPVEKMPDTSGVVDETLKRILSAFGKRLDELSTWNREPGGSVLLQIPPVGSGSTGLFNRDRFTSRVDGSNLLDGGVELPIRTVTSNTVVQATDFTVLVDATTANLVIYLPAANLTRGRVYCIKKVDASGNTVTITPTGGNLIDGAATNVIAAQWDSVIIQSNGLNWYLLSLV